MDVCCGLNGQREHGGSVVQLHTLLQRLDPKISLENVPDAEISTVQEDSRLVTPGALFVARGGTKTDGRQFATDAAARGAAAVVTELPIDGCRLPQVMVPDSASAASLLAHAFHRAPSTKMKVFGITGTNGKTTTAYLIRHLLKKISMRCG